MNNLTKILKNNKTIFSLLIVIIVIGSIKATRIIKENLEDECPVKDKSDNMGQTAKDACNRVSTRAKEIEAEAGGAEKVIQSALGFLSPKGLASGDNTVETTTTSIIKNDLSTCEITKIKNVCSNSVSSTQINILDTSNCPFCQTNGCTIDGNKQTNVAEISQTCSITALLETLMKKKNSVDSQALAQVLQKAEGLLSGDNKVTTDNCTVLDNDMSSKSYFESISECSNKLQLDQQNKITGCGAIMNNIQGNNYKSMQECLIDSGVSKKTDMESDTKVKSEVKAEQASIGPKIDMPSLIIIAVIIGALIIIGLLVYIFF
jgi:hypothetical protein